MASKSLSAHRKEWLVDEITGKACWCGYVATLFPNDQRSTHCCDTLQQLAAAVKALPDTHPLFRLMEQIDRLDGDVRLRWLDEMDLEFSHIGWLSDAAAQQAIQQLIKITEASLKESGQPRQH